MNSFKLPIRSRQMIFGLLALFSLILSACAPMAAQKPLNAPALAATPTSLPAPVTAPATPTSIPTTAPQPTQPPAATATEAMPTAASPANPTATLAPILPLESKKNAKLGKLLATAGGMTLYTFGKDSAGVSTCTTSPCTDYWPPLTVSGTPTSGAPISGAPTAEPDVKGTLGTITRPDGTLQVTFNGMPLYFFALDKAPGDANGNNVDQYGGVWHVVSLESAPKTPPSGGGMGGSGGYHY